MWPGWIGYGWLWACVYGVGGVFKYENYAKIRFFSVGTREAFGSGEFFKYRIRGRMRGSDPRVSRKQLAGLLARPARDPFLIL